MSQPQTKIYHSKKDYTNLPEIEVISDEKTEKAFDRLQSILILIIVFLISAHALLSFIFWNE